MANIKGLHSDGKIMKYQPAAMESFLVMKKSGGPMGAGP
ncbi:hypothetical protein BF49_5587 [Bradyrhizobium sp.]|nr:hypothetical protein BF49_5587 [Bradyrhizobium sp.]